LINLFPVSQYININFKTPNLLHGPVVREFEDNFKKYVGAKYACSINHATNAIFLALKKFAEFELINIPSIIPPTVVNAVINSGHSYRFVDNTEWIGGPYILHQCKNFKIIDSAQQTQRKQFQELACPEDLMIFSFYPTKPLGGLEGGMIVSDDKEKIDWFRSAVNYGQNISENSWDRTVNFPGWKMYMNSLQAHVLNEKLSNLDEKQSTILDNRNYLNNKLGYKNTSLHLYRVDTGNVKKFIEYMKEQGVMCGLHYEPLHNHSVYKTIDKCPYSECQQKASIPFHEDMTLDELKYLVKLVNDWNKK